MNRKCYPFSPLLPIMALAVLISACATTGRSGTPHATQAPITLDKHSADKLRSDAMAGHETQILRIYQKSAEHRPELTVQTGRYSGLAAIPTDAQRHPLHVIIEVRIPDEIVTLEQAIHYLLRRSGYTLNAALPPEVTELLTQPLPDVQRSLGPITLKDALTVLTTPNYVPREDPQTRMISYFLIEPSTGAPL